MKEMAKVYCGIGDCLLYIQILLNNRENFPYEYTIDSQVITSEKSNSKIYYEFIKNLYKLFNLNIEFNKQYTTTLGGNIIVPMYPIKKLTLANYIEDLPNLPPKYIVLQMSTRYCKIYDPYNFEEIANFFNTFEFKIPVILLGPRTSNIISDLLINNSFYKFVDKTKFIDYTSDDNLAVNPNIEIFKRDLSIVKNAELCLNIGCGGAFCINIFFGKKILTYMNHSLNFENMSLPIGEGYYYKYFLNNFNHIQVKYDFNSFKEALIKFIN